MKGVGYTSDILEDAQAYADHAMRAGKVEVADVECAVQARSGWEFGEGAPKDVSGHYWRESRRAVRVEFQ